MLTAYALAVLCVLVLDVFLNLATYLRPYVDPDPKRRRRWRAVLIALVLLAAIAALNLVSEMTHVR